MRNGYLTWKRKKRVRTASYRNLEPRSSSTRWRQEVKITKKKGLSQGPLISPKYGMK